MGNKQKFIAIRRDTFTHPQEGEKYRYHVDVPMILLHSHPEDKEFTPKGAPGLRLPDRYFIIPITSAAEWDGTEFLMDITRKMEEDGKGATRGSFTTMRLPQLRHNDQSENVSAMQVGTFDYGRLKKLLGKDLIEAHSLTDLFQKYRDILPEERPKVTIPPLVEKMLSRVPDGPLSGVLVVAFDQQIAGSLASEELARAGATVIKVERAGTGDPKRHNSTKTAFNTFNAGKFSVVFDDSPEDQALKAALLAKADVVIDNRSEKAQKRDGVLQETLKEERPKPMVYCAISGFGRGSETPAYDRVVQASSGMAELNGKLISFPLIDMATGKEAAREIVNHLFWRERMVPRQQKSTPCIRLDISMAATALNMMANSVATYLDTGETKSTIVPFDLYEAHDGKMAVAIATDEQFAKLCDAIDAPDLKIFPTNKDRRNNREYVEAIMRQKLVKKTVNEWVDILKDQDIPCSPVVSLADAINKYGHDVIKPTIDGGLVVSGPTRSNQFPSNPLIGKAPKHGQDKEAVAALVGHMQEHKGPRILRDALSVASNAPGKAFQQNYRFVDVHEIDFTKSNCDLPWAKGAFISIKKVGKVHAVPARKGEVVEIRHNEIFKQKRVAMEGDWVIATSFGDSYLLPTATFLKNYKPVDGKSDEFMPNPELPSRKAVRATENIKFMSPSNDLTFIPKGGLIVQGSTGAYGIHPNNIESNYEFSRWQDKFAAPSGHSDDDSAGGSLGSKSSAWKK